LERDLIIAPLPAKRQLWEACDEFAWKEESERESGMKTTLGLAANGELVRLDESQGSGGDVVLLQKYLNARASSRRIVDWEEWCSGMDGMGGLVMLAASLIE
jgi:hypothetical protein